MCTVFCCNQSAFTWFALSCIFKPQFTLITGFRSGVACTGAYQFQEPSRESEVIRVGRGMGWGGKSGRIMDQGKAGAKKLSSGGRERRGGEKNSPGAGGRWAFASPGPCSESVQIFNRLG